jgi:hypothetical protein
MRPPSRRTAIHNSFDPGSTAHEMAQPGRPALLTSLKTLPKTRAALPEPH